jgi:hypothetical protein
VPAKEHLRKKRNVQKVFQKQISMKIDIGHMWKENRHRTYVESKANVLL